MSTVPSGARAPTILVVDDSLAVRQLTVSVLRRQGYDVLEAGDGREGLDTALREQPDVILCDIHMPILDGWDVVREARSSEALGTTPILMLTSDNDRVSVRRAMAAGADDYLTKPWTQNELISAVVLLLEKASRHRADAERAQEQLRSAVLATIPHELRTPMVSILGATELLLTRRERYTPERVQGMLEDVHRSALALGRTISRMMDWAELSAAQAHRETRSMAYRLDVAQAMPEVLGSTAFAKEVQAVLKVPQETVSGVFAGHPVQVRVEPCHLQCWSPDFHKIMTELLVNALRFSKPGRPVGVTGKALPHGRYQLEIANLGVAMPEKFISQIGALSQADREVHEQQGMGLGLAIGQLAARRNGATLHVTRFDGLPTVVRLTFMQHSAEPEQSALL
ncbi:MAG: response regulator [Rhodoferax sp.]|uniref:hybrid sensor histidine kinase/response regulator n=1 Tax=Rhodoferax sp. TaxID=50421 RepID=UPI002ACD758E|nr:response regulator [Rhodoferax sp.]MDZ7893122.1 response regulator [Rhodoferax sp.]